MLMESFRKFMPGASEFGSGLVVGAHYCKEKASKLREGLTCKEKLHRHVALV